MTSPLAVVSLTYDAVDLQVADLSIFFQILNGLNEPPRVRGTDSVVPSLGGRVEGLRVNDVLSIELVGIVQADAAEDDPSAQRISFRTNAKFVRTLFLPNRDRADLVAGLEDGTTWTVSARPLNAIWTPFAPGLCETVSVSLEGYDDWAETA